MRKRASKFLSLFLVLAMVCSLFGTAMAAEGTTQADGDVVVLYTNDVHTYIDNNVGEGNENGLTYSKVAGYKDSLDNALLVDAGDHIQGTAYGSMDKGATIIELMNAAGYDLATLGNHEFDYDMEGTLAAIEAADFPYVSCNFYHEENGVAGDNVLDSYQVFEVGGVKIAFVGITTPESFTKSTPAYFQDDEGNYIYGIAGGEDGTALYEAVQEAIDAASAEADYVIALGHLGVDASSQPWTSREVIANTTGLDAFIDGHSHTTIPMEEVTDKDGNTVVLTQTGSYLDAMGQMTISADGTITTQLLTGEDLADVTPDADVKAIEDAWISEINTELGQVIGRIDDTLTNYAEDGTTRLVRKQETNTGDFAADALYYLFDNMGLDVDVAVMNGGGIRNTSTTGDISYLTCKEIHTFGNVACLQTVTGQQILDALEWGAKDVTADGAVENGGFLQVSGLKYTINTSIPSTVQQDDKGVWTGGPTGGYRVTDVQVLNNETGAYEPLDLTASYNLAGYNYTLRDLGDGFAMFEGAVNVLDYVMEDYMVLANYVQSFENGVVTGYAEPAGRITIVNEPVSTGYPADLDQNAWYYNAAVNVLDAGIMNGTNKGFEPTGTVTRATVYQTLYNMEGQPEATATVTDVDGKWYANAINWAAQAGLFEGTEFGTDAVITRAGIADIIADYAAYKGITVPDADGSMESAPDYASIPAENLEGMTFCFYAGVMTGDQKGNLNPDGQLTRAEFAQVLVNFGELEPSYVETVVSIHVDEQDGIPAHDIPATLTMPVSATADAKVPAVVMLHGTGSNRDEAGMGYAMAAPRMAADGIATLRIDFMGNGDSTASYTDYNYTSAIIDAKAAADYLAGLETVDADNLGVMGWSQGGTDALLAAEAHPDTFKAVVTWAGALELNGDSLFAGTSFAEAQAEAEADGSYTMTFDWREPLELGARWFQEVADTDMLEIVANIEAPILAINGASDTTVTPDNAEKIVEASTNEASEVLLIENCDHTYNVFSGDFTALYETVDATTAFFQAQLIPAAAEAAA